MLKNLSLSNLDLRKLKQRDITIIVLVLTVLLGVAWYYFMFNPIKDRIAQLETQLQELEARRQVGEAAKANLPLLEEQLLQAEADKADFLDTLPKESEVADLIATLRQSALDSQVALTSISQGGAGSDAVQDIRSISFNIATTGDFAQTMTFLDTLENLQRFTKVSQVGFSPEGEGVENPGLNTTFDFDVYVYTGSETADPVIEDTAGEANSSDTGSNDTGDTGETP
jgi:type IV pilus assembly protein PilO